MSNDVGIVCPECSGKLRNGYKRRKGVIVRRCYKCQNANCPAQLRGERVVVYTNEELWMTRSVRVKSINRMRPTKAPDKKQNSLAFEEADSNIEPARK